MLTGSPGLGGFLWQEYNALVYEHIYPVHFRHRLAVDHVFEIWPEEKRHVQPNTAAAPVQGD